MDKRTSELFTYLKKFLPLIGQAKAAEKMEVTAESDTEYHIDFDGIGIDCGYEIEVPSILKNQKALGYRVYYWKTYNNYPHAPDDVEDVTHAEVRYVSEVLTAVGELYARDIAQGIIECTEEPCNEPE